MKKYHSYLLVFIFVLFVTGCTIGQPEYYDLFLFKGESQNWSVELEYVDERMGRGPEDKLIFLKKDDSAVEQLTYEIEGTDINGVVKISGGEGTITVEGLKPHIDSLKDDDNFVDGSVNIKVSWNEEEELIPLEYETVVSRDARSFWEVIFSIFK